jgi:protein-S-isoprenylcysteine O-methyltransferase Ste14
MTSLNQPPRPKPYSSPFAAYAVLVVAWSIGSVSLVAFFGLFVFLGSLNLVDLALGETTKLAWDALLCVGFFVQHSGMVRRSYRQWSGKLLPSHYDGAAYTIASGVALLMLVVFWQESAHTLASPEGVLRWLLRAIYFLSITGFAWGIMALGSFDTFGLRPILDRLRGTDSPPLPFTVRGPYRWVRHPLYSFSLLMFWSCPELTVDRLLFNVLWTAWIIAGTVLEERDLVAVFGEAYRDYQGKVAMLIPRHLYPVQ